LPVARKHGRHCKVYLDEFDISGDSSSVEAPQTVSTAETSSFGDSAQAFIPGQTSATVSINSFWTDGTTGTDAVLEDYRDGGETAILTYCPGGADDGAPCYTNADAICTGVTPSSTLTGAVMLNSQWQCSGAVERMLVLYEGTITETTTGAAVDFGGAGTALAGAAVVHVTAVEGSGTIDVKLQESSDNDADAYADESGATATQMTAVGAQRFTWAGATEQYVKAVITVAGFTSVTILVAAKCGAVNG
jgi:hypothetical protein